MNLYEQYAQVSKEIEALEAKQKLIKDDIAKELPEDGIKNDYVTAFWKVGKKWKYSPKVDGLKAELDSTKEKEEKEGIAVFEEVKTVNIKVK